MRCNSFEENTGYAGLAEYRDSLLEKTPYVTLVDCGDAVQHYKFISKIFYGSGMKISL